MKKIILVALIISSFYIVGCNKNEKNNIVDQEANNSSDDTRHAEIVVSLEEATNKFLEVYPDTAVTEIDLDKSFGHYYYTVTGVDNEFEYDVQIDAQSGNVKKEDKEKLDTDEQNGVKKENEGINLAELIDLRRASQIAEQEIGQGEAVEWSLTREFSITYWEITVEDGAKEVDVKIDAKSGTVIEVDK